MTCARGIILPAVLAIALTASPHGLAQTTQPAQTQTSDTQPALTPEQWMSRGDQAMAAGDPAAAIDAYTRVVQARPNSLDALVMLGDACVRANSLLQAKEAYEAALKLSASDWRIHFGLGTIYLQQSYFRLARPFLERSLSLAPVQSRPPVLRNLALTYRGLYRMSEAIDRARQALGIDPADMDARRLLIGLYIESDRLDDALAENRAGMDMVRKDLASRPDDRWAVERLAQVYAQRVDVLQRKLVVRPDDVAIRLELADSYEQRHLADQQVLYFQSLDLLAPALEVAPDNPDLLIAVARLSYLVGRPAQAAEHLEKALQIVPDHPEARELLQKAQAAASAAPAN